MKINMQELVPKDWIIEDVGKHQIKIFYINKGRGNSPKPFVLPKEIDIDEQFVEAIGMYIGDGKLSKDQYHLDFTSMDRDMAKFILEFFTDRFNIKAKQIQFRIMYDKSSENMIDDWASFMGIPENWITLRQTNRHNNECLSMQIGGKIFRLLFGKIVDIVLSLDFEDNMQLRRAFLRGLFAAEGNIAINKSENYIVCIGFHLSYHKEEKLAILMQKILDMEGITSRHATRQSHGERYLQITNWKNYCKCWRIGLFSRNIRKEKIFMGKLSETKFSCSITQQIKDILFNCPTMSRRQLAFGCGSNPASFSGFATGKRYFINLDHLINLAKFANLSIDRLKRSIDEFRVNDITPINDSEFIDYIFDMKTKE